MQWLDRIVHSFIMTFGITEPSPEKRQRANLFIGLLLLLVLLGFFSMVFWGIRHLAH
ncbi:hypothetical protein HDF17_002814 [Granulicella arctica]|uniref:Uncharacterized protein n=1 Tax=Granulicella arctica TaxID=940613 RepID=A0A7Y9PIG0_9BACT|nr:hypothetical protein [Granulicella arctica]